jgi:hypothetical protein
VVVAGLKGGGIPPDLDWWEEVSVDAEANPHPEKRKTRNGGKKKTSDEMRDE